MLDMLAEVYKVFGLTYKLALSTRPESYLGKLDQWDAAESALTEALNRTGLEWEVCIHAHILSQFCRCISAVSSCLIVSSL